MESFTFAKVKMPKASEPVEITSIKPLTEDEWGAMEGKARWDSTVALRGPDYTGPETLKWFTSSVIRYKLSKIMRVGGAVNKSAACVVVPGFVMGREKSQFSLTHFIGHISEAAIWLNIPRVACSKESWEVIMTGHYTEALKILAIDPTIPTAYRAHFAKQVNTWPE